MTSFPVFSVTSQGTTGSSSGSCVLLSEHPCGFSPHRSSLSTSPGVLLSTCSGQTHTAHTPEASTNVIGAQQPSPSPSLHTCPSAPLSIAEADTCVGDASAQSSENARGTPVTLTSLSEPRTVMDMRASTVVSTQNTMKGEGGRLDCDDHEEVHSCITLSSTTTSPMSSQVPQLPLVQPSSTSAVEEDPEGWPSFSADSFTSSLRTTLADALTPKNAGSAREVHVSPQVKRETVEASARHTADTAVSSYRVLDSEPSGSAAGLKRENTLEHRLRTTMGAATAPAASIPIPPQSAATHADTLSPEQRYAYHLAVHEKRSIFITGGAGTGKSHLLRTIIKDLPCSSTFVTATTGIAALNVSGTTLHSFVGCGVPNKRTKRSKILGMVMGKVRCVRNWRRCRVLIIDEVSMLKASFFDLVDYIARHVRNRPHEPFGGIQLILSGDFLQLPPVVKEPRNDTGAPFCFLSTTWHAVNPKICLLSTPFRQRDLRFFELLNEMRFGNLQPDSVALLQSLDTTNCINFVRRLTEAEEGGAARPMHAGVKRERNSLAVAVADNTTGHLSSTFYDPAARPGERPTRLELVDGMGRPIDAPFDGYTILRPTRAEVDAQNERYFNQLDTEIFTYVGTHTGAGAFPANNLSEVVHLRKGCRVMMIKNCETGTFLVNGSTGVVTGFLSFEKDFRFQTLNMTFNDARGICVGRGGDRVRRHTMLPIVSFHSRSHPEGTRTVEIVVEPQEWVEKEGELEKSRSVQIPLVLAYAITIHKSQGLSLTHVDIDFAKVFEGGQSYVALSRCTDLRQIRLHGFNVRLVSANQTALAYYKALALHQRRLEWQRQHTPQVVAAMEDTEACSCTPYGYVLRDEPTLVGDYDDVFDDLYNSDDGAEEEGTTEYTGVERHLTHFNLTADAGEGKVHANETQRLDALRRRIVPFLNLTDSVKRLVRRETLPLTRVRNARLVMDIDALFHLITGPASATTFDVLFDEQGNMMRVPLCVQHLIEEAAAYRGSSESTPPSRMAWSLEQLPAVTETDAAVRRDAALLEASDVAAEALVVMARAKQDFILDIQRPEQTVTMLPEPKRDWLRFTGVLPLLLRRPTEEQMATGSHDISETEAEVNFVLNRDPREAVQHRAIIEYALFLRDSFGQDVAVCTDSILLAAYALAWGLRVVSAVSSF